MGKRDAAFTEYFVSRAEAMRGTAYLLCGDWHRAEDLVQTTFVKLYRVWHRVARHEVLDGYTRQVLVRTFLDERRRGWWLRERVDAEPTEQRVTVPHPPEDRLVMIQALALVPPRQRAVLILRYWEDQSLEETASVLNCSVGTVKSQAARGLERLRAVLAADNEENLI